MHYEWFSRSVSPPSLDTNEEYNQKDVFVVELNDIKDAIEKQERKERYDPYNHREVDHPTT